MTDMRRYVTDCIALTLTVSALFLTVLYLSPAPEGPPARAEVAQMLEDGATPVRGIREGDGPMHWDCAATPTRIVCADGFTR